MNIIGRGEGEVLDCKQPLLYTGFRFLVTKIVAGPVPKDSYDCKMP